MKSGIDEGNLNLGTLDKEDKESNCMELLGSGEKPRCRKSMMGKLKLG